MAFVAVSHVHYSCINARDVISGLRDLIEVSGGGELLDPDYNKSVLEVYRDSLEALKRQFLTSRIPMFFPTLLMLGIRHGFRKGINLWCFGIRCDWEERYRGNRLLEPHQCGTSTRNRT